MPNLYQILLLQFSGMLIGRLPSPVLGAQETVGELQVCAAPLSNDRHMLGNDYTRYFRFVKDGQMT